MGGSSSSSSNGMPVVLKDRLLTDSVVFNSDESFPTICVGSPSNCLTLPPLSAAPQQQLDTNRHHMLLGGSAGSDGDSMPESPLSLDDDMETECYPCIPMQSAVSQGSSHHQVQVKQEQPDEDEDELVDVVDVNKASRKSARKAVAATASSTHSLLNRTVVKKDVQPATTLIYTSQQQQQQQLQISLPAGRLHHSQFANSHQVQQARGINRITTRATGLGAAPRHPQSVLKPQPSRVTSLVEPTAATTTTILVSTTPNGILTTTTARAPVTCIKTAAASSLKPFSLVTARPQQQGQPGHVLTAGVARNQDFLASIKTEPHQAEAAASTSVVFSRNCIASSSPFHTSVVASTPRSSLTSQLISNQPTDGASGVLVLTEEEKKTLISEGYPIPTKLPLSKSEEKSLKKIRRKIKNKISAQESRRKKKEFVDTLEQKVSLASAEVDAYKKRCEVLQKQNASLISQLNSLRAMIGNTSDTPEEAEQHDVADIKVEPAEAFSVTERGSKGLDLD